MDLRKVGITIAVSLGAVFGGMQEGQATAWAWQQELTGESANAEGVIALWRFDKEAPGEDNSGNRHAIILRGTETQFVEDGKFGGGLKVEGDAQEAAGGLVKKSPELTPEGAFSIEMWIRPSEALTQRETAYLIDNKYLNQDSEREKSNHGYNLHLRRSGDAGAEQYTLVAALGLAEGTEQVRSSVIKLPAGEWAHVAFTYDGEKVGKFYLNGLLVGEKELKNGGSVQQANRDLVIGDRVGSTYYRFAGTFSQVRLLNNAMDYAGMMTKGVHLTASLDFARKNYFRMEEDQGSKVLVHNHSGEELNNVRVALQIEGQPQTFVEVAGVKDGESKEIEIPFDTTLKAGDYQVTAVMVDKEGKELGNPVVLEYALHHRINPDRMPVVMWGGSSVPDQLREIGFTHYFAIFQSSTADPIAFYRETSLDSVYSTLDRLVPIGMEAVVKISPVSSPRMEREPLNKYGRVDRNGNPYSRNNVDGLFPEVQEIFRKAGEWAAEKFAWSPVATASLIDTEVRDGSRPSFHDIDKEAYKEFSGKEIPKEIAGARGVPRGSIAGFPANGVLPDDFPVLEYLRWFWRVGDGWNKLHSIVHHELKKGFGDDFWTWFDPAVRAPSIWGSGGDVDYLSQWTYSYPDPGKIALATDELFAMADGKPDQKVMKMTQVIWYRNQTAPMPQNKGSRPATQAAWEKEEAEAKFITISPDHLKEALWLKLSYSVQGVMYHGIGSLLPNPNPGGYRYTNPDTVEALKDMLKNVVEPLGPALKAVPEISSDIAVLQSFTSQMFESGAGTYGWGRGWAADSYLVLRYAGIQPDIIYEEHIQNKALDNYKVLVMTECQVLTESIVKAIHAFQDAGGIVIGDEKLCPEIQADILMTSFRREVPDQDKKLMLEKATALLTELDGYYERSLIGSNPEILARKREAESGQYVFLANDARKYGNYVGHHRMVMEEGVPAEGEIKVKDGHPHVFDLVHRKKVSATNQEGWTNFAVSYEGGGGGIYLLLEEPVQTVKISGKDSVKAGEKLEVKVEIQSADSKTVDTVIPVTVTVKDANGETAEKTGFYAAEKGELQLDLDIAANDAIGEWTVEVEEATQGIKGEYKFQVQK